MVEDHWKSQKKDIARTKARARHAKSTKTCFDCGDPLVGKGYSRHAGWGYDAKFCPECDKRQEIKAQLAAGWPICPKCGSLGGSNADKTGS